jgi:iron complex outermembrane receptor protein
MNTTGPAVSCRLLRALVGALRSLLPLALSGVVVLTLLSPSVRAAEAGTITGTVNNLATGNLLEGAKIDVPALGLSTLTDNTGRFVLAAVPAGTHEVVASYLGLDAMRSQVTVTASGRAVRNFDLTTGIYKLQEFKVTGDREGAAAAITAQRNADNVKNIVSMDSFGNLPNRSPGEVAIRLPGVAGNLDAEGNVTSLVIRGMGPGLNSTTADNTIMASEGGMGRNFPMSILTGALFEQVELIKGHTPDKGAESMGGTLNLKTRSALSMADKRRITYSFAGRLAPSFTEQIPLREAHRFHPLFNVGYQEIFSVLGGERNLGVVVNTFYSENVAGMFRATRDFQNTTAQPAYVWDYRTQDIFNNRKQASANMKVEYRLSPATKFMLSAQGSRNDEPFERRYETRAYAAQTVGTTGTAGILPGYTNRITQVRAATGSIIDVTGAMYKGWNQKLRNAGAGVEHEYERLQIDYGANFSDARVMSTRGHDGQLIMRLNNVGWILDRTQSDLYPRFTQTEGLDFNNPANYRPAPNGLNNRNDGSLHKVREVRGNVRYLLPTPMPLFLKTGFNLRQQSVSSWNQTRRWSYIGTGPLAPDAGLITFDSIKTGRRIPQWQTDTFIKDGTPVTPALWAEDQYYRETVQYTGTRSVTEAVSAGYFMAQGKLGREGALGRSGFLTGVRTEKTENESWGWVRARNGSTTAEQLADPVGAAKRDYANTRREISGGYTKSFPSVHLTHEVTPNIKARLSWSTSFGRPSLSNSLPNETFNLTAQTLTINNPALLPQVGSSWDATLDYYFEPVGNLSIGWFSKKIRDFIVSGINVGTVANGTDNGYNGEYAGFTRLTTANAGTATVQGWEASYQQQLTFLPGLLKGLSFSANYTWLDTNGDFGGTTNLSSGQVAGFIPRTGNVSLSWRHRAFSARFLVNYTGDYISSYTATSIGRNLYRYERTSVNTGVEYRVRPGVSLTLDVANPFGVPQKLYRGIPDQMQSTISNFTTITVGVSGRF